MTAGDLPLLPPRDPDGHKGTFGSVLVIGGSALPNSRMIGAPALAATAALRSGCGLARIACPEPVLDAVMSLCPSATGVALPTNDLGEFLPHEAARAIDAVLETCDAAVLGPGLGAGDAVETVVLRMLRQERLGLVLDADGLNAASRLAEPWNAVRAPLVLTPHPGEYDRLAEPLRLPQRPETDEERSDAAASLAQRTGSIVVLKGARTVVSDGQRTWRCGTSCPALATGGTGDLLAGLVAGLIARCVPRHRPEIAALPGAVRAKLPADASRPLDHFEAACIAVDAHAACGARWSREARADGGLLAQELAELIPAELSRRSAAAPRS